tara:strand:+ start:1020 stop:1271 length:252 start_codon:yes stop_codon:yes gene_type:complete
MATIKRATSRLGDPLWVVVWGPGLTQTAICLSEAEAVEVSKAGWSAKRGGAPLVSFRENVLDQVVEQAEALLKKVRGEDDGNP